MIKAIKDGKESKENKDTKERAEFKQSKFVNNISFEPTQDVDSYYAKSKLPSKKQSKRKFNINNIKLEEPKATNLTNENDPYYKLKKIIKKKEKENNLIKQDSISNNTNSKKEDSHSTLNAINIQTEDRRENEEIWTVKNILQDHKIVFNRNLPDDKYIPSNNYESGYTDKYFKNKSFNKSASPLKEENLSDLILSNLSKKSSNNVKFMNNDKHSPFLQNNNLNNINININNNIYSTGQTSTNQTSQSNQNYLNTGQKKIDKKKVLMSAGNSRENLLKNIPNFSKQMRLINECKGQIEPDLESKTHRSSNLMIKRNEVNNHNYTENISNNETLNYNPTEEEEDIELKIPMLKEQSIHKKKTQVNKKGLVSINKFFLNKYVEKDK